MKSLSHRIDVQDIVTMTHRLIDGHGDKYLHVNAFNINMRHSHLSAVTVTRSNKVIYM